MMNKNKLPLSLLFYSSFTYVFLEWLFIATKPSVLSSETMISRLSVLATTTLALSIVALIFAYTLGLVGILKSSPRSLIHLNLTTSKLVSALLITLCLFLLIDNFTHTIFGFYVGDAQGIGKILYAIAICLLFLLIYREISKLAISLPPRGVNTIFLLTRGSTLIFLGIFVATFPYSKKDDIFTTEDVATSKPNIIIISADGVNASHMSAYGYKRKTTPFLEQLASESLFSVNSFTNNANTTGSVASLLTGRLPTSTKVIYRPDILKGGDTYLHLPKILNDIGYATHDISVAHFADAKDLNFKDAFRNKTKNVEKSRLLTRFSSIENKLGTTFSFVYEIADRIYQRVAHILGIKNLWDPYKMVTDPIKHQYVTDLDKLKKILSIVDSSPQPFFIHSHMMNTHGAKFPVNNSVFSKGIEQTEDWMDVYYDDAIREFDSLVETIYNQLKEKNILENSILIITSDHGQKYTTFDRLPFIIRFPESKNAKKIYFNTQRIDIAPTILDFMGVPAPDWMEGRNLLGKGKEDEANNMLTFSAGAASVGITEQGRWEVKDYSSPYFSLGHVSLLQCDQWFSLNIKSYTLSQRRVPDYVGGCESSIESLSKDDARNLLTNLLQSSGYPPRTSAHIDTHSK